MIRIAYAHGEQSLAEQIRDDLAGHYDSAPPILIVLVSAASSEDPAILAEIKNARKSGTHLLPILTENIALPQALAYDRPLNFASGYQVDSLMRRLSGLAMSGAELKRANRRALLVIGGIAAVMFGFAVIGILAGHVAFPVAEYNEEATFQAQWIDGLIRETLEYAQPHSTEDALNFSATLEAAPTRLYYYIRGTATALPRTQGG